jgi:phosphoglycerate dehydrogenase-like enzyme
MMIRLLLSPLARERLSARVEAIAKEHDVEIVFVEPSARNVDIAFITRDITGRSTKHKVLADTQAYYDALLHSPTISWVHIHSAGVDRPVYQALLERGVTVTPSAGINAKEVAQTVLGGILSLARKFPQLARAQRTHTWAPTLGADIPRQLAGQTALVVGWGPIGQQIAGYLTMLEFKVVVVRHDASKKAANYETVAYEQINSALPRADWVVLCCPLSPATRHLIGAKQIGLMPTHSHLINVSRGETIDEPVLEAALLEKRIAGAFLDVFAHEPLSPNSPIWDMENVMVTPHSAGFSDGNEAKVDELFLRLLGARLVDGIRTLG